MRICLNATDVAAFIERNPYHSREQVFVKIWKRSRFLEFQKAKREYDSSQKRQSLCVREAADHEMTRLNHHRKRAFDTLITQAVDNHDKAPVELIKHVVPSIICKVTDGIHQKRDAKTKQEDDITARGAIHAAVRDTFTNETVQSKVVDIIHLHPPTEASEKLQTDLDVNQEEANKLVQAAQQSLKSQLSTLVPSTRKTIDYIAQEPDTKRQRYMRESLASSIPNATTRKEVVSRVQCQSGIQNEKSSLDTFEVRTGNVVHSRNKTMYKRVLYADQTKKVIIQGFVDGLSGKEEDTVIESKRRQNHLFGRIVERERVQLYVYMYLTGRRKGTLLETFENTQQTHSISFDQSQWDIYVADIRASVDHLVSILKSPDKQLELLRQEYSH
jgi:hypothetical protein